MRIVKALFTMISALTPQDKTTILMKTQFYNILLLEKGFDM